MRRKLDSIGVASLMFCLVFVFACNNERSDGDHSNHETSEGKYICPMRCEGSKSYSQPGTCPVCNMKLELVESELIQTAPPNKQVLSRQATIKLQQGMNEGTFTAQGYIVPAQNRNQSVAARFGGRIEKLYVKFSNQYVKRGDKIMDIYSPDLRTLQEEHLFLLKSNDENSFIERSRDRLRLLGITENQIVNLEKDGTVASTLSVFSPANGYVFFNTESTEGNAASGNSSVMNDKSAKSMNSNKDSYNTSASQIREGMYINQGQTIFSVNDLQEVWALVSIANPYVNQIEVNQPIEVVSESNPSKRFKGRVVLIEPTFEEANQRFSRIRVALPNANYSLKLNSLVRAQVSLTNNQSLQVPASAVFKTGLNAYVWVKVDTTQKGTGLFQLRKVVAGASNNGIVFIQSGLSSNEEIAKEAGLMTDSETFLSEN